MTRSDPRGRAEATVPATVTLLDGQSSTTFEIAAVDDSDVDGTQTVTLSAAAADYAGASATLEVTDDDVPLVLNVAVADASIAEGAGAAATTATVTRSDPRGDLTVALTSDDTSEATVPATVTLLDGQSSTTFEIAAVDDSDVDGTQTVTLSAAAADYAGASATLEVTDDDVPLVLSLSIADQAIVENAGGATDDDVIVIEVVDNQDSGFTRRVALGSKTTSQRCLLRMAVIITTCEVVVVRRVGPSQIWRMASIRWLPPGHINTTISTTCWMLLSRLRMAAVRPWQPLR